MRGGGGYSVLDLEFERYDSRPPMFGDLYFILFGGTIYDYERNTGRPSAGLAHDRGGSGGGGG
jgi:hypothetical protein